MPVVVVTGLGAVSPFGWGVAALWDGLLAGRAAIGAFDRFDHGGAAHPRRRRRCRGRIPTARTAPRDRAPLSHADRFALAAAAEALAQAGLPLDLRRHRGGRLLRRLHRRHVRGRELLRRLHRREAADRAGLAGGRSRSTPRPTRWRGVSACADPSRPSRRPAPRRRWPSGRRSTPCAQATVEVALAGGSDALCRLTYAGFNSLRAVDAAAVPAVSPRPRGPVAGRRRRGAGARDRRPRPARAARGRSPSWPAPAPPATRTT